MALKEQHSEEDPRDELSVGAYIRMNRQVWLVLEVDNSDAAVQNIMDDGVTSMKRFHLRNHAFLVNMPPEVSPEELGSLEALEEFAASRAAVPAPQPA